jgi:phage tail tape-measure protein
MKKIYKVTLLPLLLSALAFQSGCSTPSRSAGAGALAGGVAGAGLGALADPGRGGENRFRNVVIGTAIGSGVGAGAGFMLGEHVKDERDAAREDGKRNALKDAQTHAASSSGTTPRLIPARTEAHWVPDQIRGNTFVPGHFEYQIIENARWESGQ